MKIISLLGSPHGLRGNTAKLLRDLLDGAESEGARTEIIVLKGGTVLPCKGCNTCHKKGYCAQKDDFESIKKKLLDADGLVLASPNYIFNVSAQLKAFLDRCTGIVHCMQFWGKYGVSVVSSGGDGEKPIIKYMNHFLLTTGAVPLGGVHANMSQIAGGNFNDEVRDQARALGKRLVLSWKKGYIPPKVERQRNEFRERMQTLITYREKEWPYEYLYWKEHMNF